MNGKPVKGPSRDTNGFNNLVNWASNIHRTRCPAAGNNSKQVSETSLIPGLRDPDLAVHRGTRIAHEFLILDLEDEGWKTSVPFLPN
jgi:hypothetical protein